MTNIAFRDALAGARFYSATLATLMFKYDTVRVFHGLGILDIPGLGRFMGLGEFGQVSSLKQPVGGQAPAMSLVLSGVPDEALRRARNSVDDTKGQPALIHQGIWDADQKFVGFITPVTAIMDRMTFSIKKQTGDSGTQSIVMNEVSVALESIVASRRTKPSFSTYSDADQQRRYPGDRGCEYTSIIGQKTYQWPVI